jgi:hypothetical protein
MGRPTKDAIRPQDPSDPFAQIGAQRREYRDRHLEQIGPPKLPERELPPMQARGESGAAPAFRPARRLKTPGDVQRALAAERRRMAPFLRDLSPPFASPRRCIRLREFDWRLAAGPDGRDFAAAAAGRGRWQRVNVPHYGPPAGRAVAWYRTTFNLTPRLLAAGSLWVRLEGADYRARVYVNGRCVGEHEGFFATFEFEIGAAARPGVNVLLVELHNDGTWQAVDGVPEGDKIYAATGPGWDEPGSGWHHCPAGMGLIGPVTVEARAALFLHDVWVQPLSSLDAAEVCIEVLNTQTTPVSPVLEVAVYGQNFRAAPAGWRSCGALAPSARGVNYYAVTVPLPGGRSWSPDAPWLHQVQVRLLGTSRAVLDTARRQFGLREFRIDANSKPRGRLFLNGRPIRLRGANTMGFEQQAVMRGDLDQVRDDLLLARLTHFNFLRLTQRPVQREVYEMADRLGVMLQTDLPLFGFLRRTQFSEAVRQAAEMARHVRGHASAVLLSFINEPFPGHWRPVGHRHHNRHELEGFFRAATEAVRVEHPDAQIKPVDGDYDPPAPGLPDHHIYTLWYQGHGIPFGRLHQGCFPPVKRGWCFGSGEYGAEGLDPVDLMRRRYPRAWLPDSPSEEAAWTPSRISHAQSGRHQPLFFDRPATLDEWVRASQAWQAEAVRLQTEAYRRMDRLVSCAVHLFIDAWPAGWMKSLVDCERRPKPAWFSCREALAPWLPMLRSDRRHVWCEEEMRTEVWLANDTKDVPEGWMLRYQIEQAGRALGTGVCPAQPAACAPAFQGFLRWRAPQVGARSEVLLRVALCDHQGRTVNESSLAFSVWPAGTDTGKLRVALHARGGPSARLARDLQGQVDPDASLMLVDGWPSTAAARRALEARARAGGTVVAFDLPEGVHPVAGDAIEVRPCGFGPVDFVSRATGHPFVEGFEPDDFRFWHDAPSGRIEPLLSATFQAPGWSPVLLSGEAGWSAGARPALAVAERPLGRGRIMLCQIALAGRVQTNPAAWHFASRLLGRATVAQAASGLRQPIT